MAVLIAFQNVTKTVEGMAANGTVDPVLGLWGLCAVYFAFGLWLFFTTASQGTDSALRKCFVWIDRGIHRATGALKQSGAEETQPR